MFELKLEMMCPHFDRMHIIFGERANVSCQCWAQLRYLLGGPQTMAPSQNYTKMPVILSGHGKILLTGQ